VAKEKAEIWDPFRKKWVVRTPEEEVRQAMASYLIQELRYPESLVQTEVSLLLNTMTRRADILVDKPAGNPVLLVECKAPGIKMSQRVFEQASRYNLALKVPYLVLTNGNQHVCCQVDIELGDIRFLDSIPRYDDI